MKISIRKSNLLQGINIVSKAVSNKTTHPILSCILVEAAGGVIKLTANDMEIGIESYVDGTVIEDGKVALEAKLFSDFIRKLPDSDITIESDKDSKTLIKCERLEFNIPGKSGEDFSNLPVVSKDKFITISQFALREVINQTIFSISDNENNKLMTGELFEVSNNKLSVVSLDGHRISIRYIELKGDNSDIKVVVPGKSLSDISKIMNGGVDDPVNIYFTDNNILFEFDNTKVVSRLIEGEYFSTNVCRESEIMALMLHFFSIFGRYEHRQNSEQVLDYPKQQDHMRRFAELCAYINNHCTERLSVEDLASRAGFSVYHFSRLFKENTGMTCHNYLVARRIIYAKALLVDDTIPITEIAMRSGFNSIAPFNRLFKAQIGYTPTEYRQMASHG